MQEIWKDIKDYEGLYQVSNLGRVKSLSNSKRKKEKILQPVSISDGYVQVGLYKCGKRAKFLIHRLVAQAFLDNPNNLSQVNHINGIKSDNETKNLEWCTGCENVVHSIKYGLKGRYANKIIKTINYIERKKSSLKDQCCIDTLNDILNYIKG